MLVPHETADVLWVCSVYTIQPCISVQCHFILSHIHRVHMCLAVACHLHLWQNDWDLYRLHRGGSDTEIRVLQPILILSVGKGQFGKVLNHYIIEVLHNGPTHRGPQEMSEHWGAAIRRRHCTAAESLWWCSVVLVLIEHMQVTTYYAPY